MVDSSMSITEHSVSLTASSDCFVGIQEQLPDENLLSIYPNPATNQLFIETDGAPIEEINIYSTTGSLVSQTKQPLTNIVDISKLSNGLYVAEIKSKDVSVRKKWTKL